MRKALAVLAGVVVILVILYLKLSMTPRMPSRSEESRDPIEAKKEAEDPVRMALIGTWEDDYKGKRVMVINPDGTAVMVVEPSGLGALFAKKLTFNMEWSFDGKVLKKRTVSGEPKDQVNIILNTMGFIAKDTLLEVNAEHLLLLDEDGKQKYDWKRVVKEK